MICFKHHVYNKEQDMFSTLTNFSVVREREQHERDSYGPTCSLLALSPFPGTLSDFEKVI